MNAGGKLAVYGAALAAVFATSAGIGAAVAPVGLSNAEPPAEHSGGMDTGDGLPGLATTADDLTLVADTDTITAGVPTTYTFSVRDDDGPVVDFELEQTKRMHLIVVRRDFAGFLHLHPTMARKGRGRFAHPRHRRCLPRLRRLHGRRRQAHPRRRPVRAGRLPAPTAPGGECDRRRRATATRSR